MVVTARFGTINGGHPGALHVCGTCDYRWPVEKIYLRWPIRLKWGAGMSSQWFDWHGWELGTDRLWRRVFGWTYHLGRLKIIFGGTKHLPLVRRACQNCDATAWEPPKQANSAPIR